MAFLLLSDFFLSLPVLQNVHRTARAIRKPFKTRGRASYETKNPSQIFEVRKNLR
jgi:hypothetical protein